MAHRDAYRSESSILATLIESPNTRPASVDWEPSWSPADRAEVESSRWLVDSESTPSLEASERDLGHSRSFRLSPAGAQPGTEAQSLAGANSSDERCLRQTRSWPAPTRDPVTEHGVARGRHRHARSDCPLRHQATDCAEPSSPAPTCAERLSVAAWSDRTSPKLVARRHSEQQLSACWEHQLFPNVGRCAPRDWS
jgi:hypothetical protein